MTTREYAEKYALAIVTVRHRCERGALECIKNERGRWVICDAPPTDRRRRRPAVRLTGAQLRELLPDYSV